MTNQNYVAQWPLYANKDGAYVRGLPIKSIDYAIDGSANAKFDGAYDEQYMSAQFVSVFKPAVGGYLFRSQYGELLFLSKAAFEGEYSSASEPVANAATADKLTTARTITLTGVVKGSASFDGSGNITINTTSGT